MITLVRDQQLEKVRSIPVYIIMGFPSKLTLNGGNLQPETSRETYLDELSSILLKYPKS